MFIYLTMCFVVVVVVVVMFCLFQITCVLYHISVILLCLSLYVCITPGSSEACTKLVAFFARQS